MGRPILRTCVGCRQIRDRQELVRLTFDPQEGLLVHPLHVRGRSAYVCPSMDCFAKAWNRRVFQRAFRRDVSGLNAAEARERFAVEIGNFLAGKETVLERAVPPDPARKALGAPVPHGISGRVEPEPPRGRWGRWRE